MNVLKSKFNLKSTKQIVIVAFTLIATAVTMYVVYAAVNRKNVSLSNPESEAGAANPSCLLNLTLNKPSPTPVGQCSGTGPCTIRICPTPQPCPAGVMCKQVMPPCTTINGTCINKQCIATKSPSPTTTGAICGGIRGVKCPTGYKCVYSNNAVSAPYPDASGHCVPVAIKTTLPVLTPTPKPTTTSDSTFTGQYFSNNKLSGKPVFIRQDKNINFNWNTKSPASNIPVNNFSVRWTKSQNFSEGTYRFSVIADDGVRLIIDGKTVIDKWKTQSAKYTYDAKLSSGNHSIIMEYYEGSGKAVAKFSVALLKK